MLRFAGEMALMCPPQQVIAEIKNPASASSGYEVRRDRRVHHIAELSSTAKLCRWPPSWLAEATGHGWNGISYAR